MSVPDMPYHDALFNWGDYGSLKLLHAGSSTHL